MLSSFKGFTTFHYHPVPGLNYLSLDGRKHRHHYERTSWQCTQDEVVPLSVYPDQFIIKTFLFGFDTSQVYIEVKFEPIPHFVFLCIHYLLHKPLSTAVIGTNYSQLRL